MPMRNMMVSIGAADEAQFAADLDENLAEGHVTPDYLALLHEVVEEGTLGMLQALVARGFDPARRLRSNHSSHDTGWPGQEGSGLHYAAFLGREEICRYLLDVGCDPNARDADGATPVMATVCHEHVTVTELLMQRGADLNAQDDAGDTALCLCAEDGSAVMAAWLLARGADPNGHGDGAESPLRRAARQGQWEIAADLERHGARRDFYAAVLLGDARQVASDLAASADPGRLATEPDPHGTTPLHAAVRRGRGAVGRLLLQSGADPNEIVQSGSGTTLLMHAAARGDAKMVRALLEAGADPNARTTREKWTPLHMRETNRIEVRHIPAGASALDIAAFFERQTVEDCLRRYGARDGEP